MGMQGPMCAESTNDCGAVQATYEAQLQVGHPPTVRTGSEPLAAGLYPDTQCPYMCQVSPGHCAQGLDTCWFIYPPSPELDRLATLYESLGCPPLGPCTCPPAPDVTCEFDSSKASGDYRGPLTCTVR